MLYQVQNGAKVICLLLTMNCNTVVMSGEIYSSENSSYTNIESLTGNSELSDHSIDISHVRCWVFSEYRKPVKFAASNFILLQRETTMP